MLESTTSGRPQPAGYTSIGGGRTHGCRSRAAAPLAGQGASYKPKLPDMRHDIQDVYGFDILAICESWLTPNVPDRLLGVSGYRLYRRDRPAELGLPRGRGGVAVLVRDTLSCELLPTPTTGVAGSNLEIVWVLVHADKHRPVLVASAYRVPTNTARQLAADLEDLENQLQFMLASYPRATLMSSAPPVSADTQRLLQRRRAALAGSDRAAYKEVNRLCRAAIRRDCRARYEREIRENSRGPVPFPVLMPRALTCPQNPCFVLTSCP
ncbi:hypothetical protein FJT64_005817 [Amphibalanus amphitrite]|uniref:Uncharacterized protein n=1 Tax=Amphibalanus amphitrite TaxID=1232801 RepID=A0A6A4VR83_AMPAM|nr:hypothetical protein FJT64_005817 [Amphibalanus amphitrite]